MGVQAGGAGVVLHHWANAELERDNVRNARVVLAEALRKCPDDQPLYVLAAGVELAGGDPGARVHTSAHKNWLAIAARADTARSAPVLCVLAACAKGVAGAVCGQGGGPSCVPA